MRSGFQLIKEFFAANNPLDFLVSVPWHLIYKNRLSMIVLDRLAVVKPRLSIGSVFKKAPMLISTPLDGKKKDTVEFYFTKSATPDCFKADLQLAYYLRKHFKPNHLKKLEKQCHNLIDRLHKNRHTSMEKLSAMVRNFYDEISVQAQKLGPVSDDFCTTSFLEHIEDFVCLRAHGILFCTRSDEENLDILLQDRIRELHWVTQGFLSTVLDFDSEIVGELLNDAMAEISEMNTHKKVRDKFDCLLRCSRKIFEAIRESTNSSAGADEFLPAFTHVILKSNPTLLQSNMSFISRFSIPSKVCQGETGYYFTNLCSVIHFIQEMNANSLRMSKDVFQEFVQRNNPK